MRNLHLNDVVIKDLPMNLKKIKDYLCRDGVNIIYTGDAVFFRKSMTDPLRRINESKAIGVEWNQIENILYIATGITFECFHIDKSVNTEVYIPNGYDAYAWNSDQDQVVLVNRSGLIRVIAIDAYNGQFIELSTCNIDLDDNVITEVEQSQFALEFKDDISLLETSTLTNFSKPIVKWSRDGDVFAVGIYKNGHRSFQIYTSNCEFLNKNEVTPQLAPLLAWKPDGSIIASLRKTGLTNSVIFYERNGLYKSDLTLSRNLPVTHIEWNKQGDVLLIIQKKDEQCFLSLYTLSNNVWYLKQSLSFDNGARVNKVSWKRTKKTHISLEVITSFNVITYTWNWHVDAAPWIEDNYKGSVAIINDKTLHFTSSKDKMVPPPDCSFKLMFDESINFVAFSPNGKYMAVILSDYTAEIFDVSKPVFERLPITLRGHVCIFRGIPLSLNNFVIDNKKILYAVQTSPQLSVIAKFERKMISPDEFYPLVEVIYQSEYHINHLSIVKDCLIINNTTNLLALKRNEDITRIMTTVQKGIITVLYALDQYLVFSLYGHEFYFNNHLVSDNITSYLICHEYLLLSTVDNYVHCFKLSPKGIKQLKMYDTRDIYTRSIPKDSILITAIPESRTIVTQLPRGDLEIVKPRVLSIGLIQNLLLQSKYKEAFNVIRQDRINPNILVDINPQKFLSEISDFVESIDDCESLNMFIVSLQDNNITQELYGKCFENPLPVQEENTKLIPLLEEMINSMNLLAKYKFLHSIITAYICTKTDAGMENVLLELKNAIEIEKKTGRSLAVPTDEVFNRVVTMVTIEKLYNVALQMQDFGLIQWIASKSQLDPLEYIPFLQELNSMDQNYRSFKINNHLKRYEDAFIALVKCDDIEEELLQLVTKNNLHKLTLKYVKSDNQWYTLLMNLCGHYMNKQQRYDEAGIIFKRINCLDNAIDNFITAGNLHESLNIISMLPTDVQKDSLLNKLASSLIVNKKYKDAAYLYENHLNYYEEGIKLLIHGKLWMDALAMAQRHHRSDIIITDLKPTMLEYVNELYDMFEQKKYQFTSSKERLVKLRKSKMDALTAQNTIHAETDILHGENHNEMVYTVRDMDMDSLLSANTATTRQTGFTNLSATSSRRKKRLERKAMQTREGSVFENIAIVRQLHLIITEIQGYASIIRDACFILLSFDDCYDESAKLHNFYEKFIAIVERASNDIWTADFVTPPEPMTPWAHAVRQNIEQLEVQYRYPPPPLLPNWKLDSLTF